jgi:hypothetical protein
MCERKISRSLLVHIMAGICLNIDIRVHELLQKKLLRFYDVQLEDFEVHLHDVQLPVVN